MNNLKRIMELKNITPRELAEKTGLAESGIRRMMKDTNATPYNYTADVMAKALRCTRAQIYGQRAAAEGDKVILSERAKKAARELAEAMQDYSAEPLFLHLGIYTNEAAPHDDRAGWIDCFICLDNEKETDPLAPLDYALNYSEDLPADESETAAGL